MHIAELCKERDDAARLKSELAARAKQVCAIQGSMAVGPPAASPDTQLLWSGQKQGDGGLRHGWWVRG